MNHMQKLRLLNENFEIHTKILLEASAKPPPLVLVIRSFRHRHSGKPDFRILLLGPAFFDLVQTLFRSLSK